MSITKLNIQEFLQATQGQLIFDVRSPGEYEHAHMPNAYSLPLFTNEERKVVGTAYKQESREKAIKIGLDYFGTKTVKIIEEVEKLITNKKTESNEIGVHCWRGGMRSAAIAWLLDLYGFKVYLLNGDIIGTIEANKDKKDPELKKGLMLEAWEILSNIKSHTSDWITISKKWSKKSLIEVLL